MNEHLKPRGAAKFRRRELSEYRQNKELSDLNAYYEKRQKARDRIREIDAKISGTDIELHMMSELRRANTVAELKVERIWQQLNAGQITTEEEALLQVSEFVEKLKGTPDVFSYLTHRNGTDQTNLEMARIRAGRAQRFLPGVPGIFTRHP